MPQITFITKSTKNTSQVISTKDIKEKYLYGLPLEKDGKPIPDSVFQNGIDTAVQQLETMLMIKLSKTVIQEQKEFHHDDWVNWSYVKATYPVVCPILLEGFLGTTKQVSYPTPWLSARKTNDGISYSRILYMVPNQGSSGNQNSIVYSGIMPNLSWYAYSGQRMIPRYWTLKYITGFNKIPSDILDAVAMLTCVSLLPIISDMLMGNSQPNMAGSGVGWGVNSKSISIDGLSQSISSGASSGIFNARIKQYQETLGDVHGNKPGELQRLIDCYNSLTWTVA